MLTLYEHVAPSQSQVAQFLFTEATLRNYPFRCQDGLAGLLTFSEWRKMGTGRQIGVFGISGENKIYWEDVCWHHLRVFSQDEVEDFMQKHAFAAYRKLSEY